jgi:hypothetical protein
MAENEHGRIIAAEARAVLAPVGFRRKGRSRVWLADHGFWLGAVEFQPSGFSKGSYCNVAVHWLWGLTIGLTYDYGFHRVGSFAPFNDPEIFRDRVAAMALAAAQSAERHQAMFKTLGAAAAVLAQDEHTLANPSGWEAFHAGVACGLVGDKRTAQLMFDRVCASDDRDFDWIKDRRSKAEQLITALGDRALFWREAQTLLDAQRNHFGLVPYTLTE